MSEVWRGSFGPGARFIVTAILWEYWGHLARPQSLDLSGRLGSSRDVRSLRSPLLQISGPRPLP